VRANTALMQRPFAYAPPMLCDLVALVVSQDNSCRYCYGAQRAVLRIHGFSDDQIDRLLRDFHVAALSPPERAALDFARRLTRANPRPGRAEFEAVVHAGLPREAALEVAAVAASANFSNRLGTFLALPQEAIERFVGGPLFRFVRPLVAWRMRPRPARPTAPPVANDGPGTATIAALGTSPTAHVVRNIVDGAWGSPVLPRRTKTLLLGVVGRALGCGNTEAEARALRATHGFAPRDHDEILGTLRSRRRDAREARLVPFARETVRYQPEAIHARTREVVAGFTPEEILEAVGVLAIANAMGRLSVVLDAC
jgi:AhpD family alkylhydroperoxidase